MKEETIQLIKHKYNGPQQTKMNNACMLSHSVVSKSLQLHGLQPTGLLCPCGFSRQAYWSDCHALLQGIFPTQGQNPGLPHCRQILYHLSHAESIRYHKGKKMNFYLFLTLYRKISSKWIIDLNVRDTALMLLEEYVKRIPL